MKFGVVENERVVIEPAKPTDAPPPIKRPRGKPKGSPKTGGRKKGTTHKYKSDQAELVKKALGDDISPLEYLLGVMRNEENATERRDWAAQHAAPYVHPKLQAIAYKPIGEGQEDKKMDDITLVRNLLFAVELIKRKPLEQPKNGVEDGNFTEVLDPLPISKK